MGRSKPGLDCLVQNDVILWIWLLIVPGRFKCSLCHSKTDLSTVQKNYKTTGPSLSKPRPMLHCRVLPPVELNSVISIPLPIYLKVSLTIVQPFTSTVAISANVRRNVASLFDPPCRHTTIKKQSNRHHNKHHNTRDQIKYLARLQLERSKQDNTSTYTQSLFECLLYVITHCSTCWRTA